MSNLKFYNYWLRFSDGLGVAIFQYAKKPELEKIEINKTGQIVIRTETDVETNKVLKYLKENDFKLI